MSTETIDNVIYTADTCFSDTVKAILKTDSEAKSKLSELKNRKKSINEIVQTQLEDYRRRQFSEADIQIAAYKKQCSDKAANNAELTDSNEKNQLDYLETTVSNRRDTWIRNAVENIKF